MLSAPGTQISATCISPEAAAYLSSHGDLLPHHVSSREVFTDTVQALLHEGGRIRSRTVKANAMGEKLSFVLRVVEQWVGNGGLGRLDEDDGAMATGKGLLWEGIGVREGAKKSDRITVGRHGGDEAGKSSA